MTSQSPLPADATPPAEADAAARSWAAMQDFVIAQDRHRELREAFDFGRGIGRVTALLALADGPMTMGELAESQGVDPPNATIIVDKLENRGLVRRTPHPEGNRRKLVTLTDAGRKAAALAREIIARPPAAIAALPADDLAALDRILTRLAGTALPADTPPMGGQNRQRS
jgi:DNA-binding MarR family transcriptional regulator